MREGTPHGPSLKSCERPAVELLSKLLSGVRALGRNKPTKAAKREQMFKKLPLPFSLLCFSAIAFGSGFRINHAGRILGVKPVVSSPVLFNTWQADAIMSASEIFPRTNAWNEDITRLPILANSNAMIATISNDLRADRRTLRLFPEMNYALIPDAQPLEPILFNTYPDESDPGPYPIPTIEPVESWPVGDGAGQSLSQWQQDFYGVGGDRHAIIVQPGAGYLWETWEMLRNPDSSWQAANGARFNLSTNGLRPDGWTSGDAAGLPMFPALVRYDECERGMVEHCMRIVVGKSRKAHIYPARHDAGSTTDVNTPSMGQRLRLKAGFVIPATWSKEERAVALGLKKYGALVADNGNFFSISYCPDQRFPSNCFDHIQQISIGNFEVVQATGPTQGPRSPSPPVAVAGANQNIRLPQSASLNGFVSGGANSLHVSWYKYSGPGSVALANPAIAKTTATFSATGTYILMLKADDYVHTPAYDAIQIVVGPKT